MHYLLLIFSLTLLTGMSSLRKLAVRSWMKLLIYHWFHHKLGRTPFPRNCGRKLPHLSLKIFIYQPQQWQVIHQNDLFRRIIKLVRTCLNLSEIFSNYLRLVSIIMEICIKSLPKQVKSCQVTKFQALVIKYFNY